MCYRQKNTIPNANQRKRRNSFECLFFLGNLFVAKRNLSCQHMVLPAKRHLLSRFFIFWGLFFRTPCRFCQNSFPDFLLDLWGWTSHFYYRCIHSFLIRPPLLQKRNLFPAFGKKLHNWKVFSLLCQK